jgi:hypothetical protein
MEVPFMLENLNILKLQTTELKLQVYTIRNKA